MNIALFGTSANPPTLGHQTILQWLVKQYDYVAVWASDNPFKAQDVSLAHRSAMLNLLVEDVNTYTKTQHNGDDRDTVDQGDIEDYWQCYCSDTSGKEVATIALHPELSDARTLITVQRAKQIWVGATFTLVIGTDLVAQMPRWHKIDELLPQVKLLVVPRPGYALEEGDLDALRQMGAIVTIADLAAPKISSTTYRQWGDTEAITSTIDAYIHQHNLYNRHGRTKPKEHSPQG